MPEMKSTAHEEVEEMDTLSKKERSLLMSKIHSKNTKPEIVVRKWLHANGYRFRLHRRDLPGVPDIVLPKHKLVIFVHGCFWHRHADCKRASTPKDNSAYWEAKFSKTIERDKKAIEDLQNEGWMVLIIWECEITKIGEKLSILKSS